MGAPLNDLSAVQHQDLIRIADRLQPVSDQQDSLSPVSYTHLDVYKRQVQELRAVLAGIDPAQHGDKKRVLYNTQLGHGQPSYLDELLSAHKQPGDVYKRQLSGG